MRLIHGQCFVKLCHRFFVLLVRFQQTGKIDIVQVHIIRISGIGKEGGSRFQACRVVFQFQIIIHCQTFQHMIFRSKLQTFLRHVQRRCVVFIQIQQHGVAGIVLLSGSACFQITFVSLFCLAILPHRIIDVCHLLADPVILRSLGL